MGIIAQSPPGQKPPGGLFFPAGRQTARLPLTGISGERTIYFWDYTQIYCNFFGNVLYF